MKMLDRQINSEFYEDKYVISSRLVFVLAEYFAAILSYGRNIFLHFFKCLVVDFMPIFPNTKEILVIKQCNENGIKVRAS